MMMPGRTYTAGSSYRYGFNGKENDNELKGEGNQQDYGMRIYDTRLGKFLSVDPITAKYPELTPYQFASNRTIDGIDEDGLEYQPCYSCELQLARQSKGGEEEFHRRKLREGKATAIVMAVAVDVVVFKGKATQFVMGWQVAGAFEHNRASTPEGKVAQDGRSKEALANVFIGLGISKFAGGVFKLVIPAKPIKVDLMGGAETKLPNFINFDIKAVAGGIDDEVKNFGKYFGTNTVSEIVVNNPQAKFLTEVTESLKSGGTITLRGTESNKFFNSILNGKAEGLENFVVTEMKPTQTTGFFRTDGKPIPSERIRELKLVKK